MTETFSLPNARGLFIDYEIMMRMWRKGGRGERSRGAETGVNGGETFLVIKKCETGSRGVLKLSVFDFVKYDRAFVNVFKALEQMIFETS